MQVTSGSKVLQTDSPVGPGYYANLPSAFDSVLKKPASKFYGETSSTVSCNSQHRAAIGGGGGGGGGQQAGAEKQ